MSETILIVDDEEPVRKTFREWLEGRGIKVARSLTGSYVTSLDMAGCSLTLSVLDEHAKTLWDAPVHTPALRWGV